MYTPREYELSKKLRATTKRDFESGVVTPEHPLTIRLKDKIDDKGNIPD